MKKTKKLCYKLYHQLLKQKFSREISSLCFRAHQFGIHHKKEKYLKSDNTPPLIKIVANKKYSNLHQLQNQLLLNVVVAVQKKYLCDRLKTPKMASGHYWKVQKICNWNWKIRKQKETNKQIEMVNRYHKGKHGMNVNGILWVHVVWMFVRKTEPVINLIPIMNRLDQTGSKWFICAFQGCQGLITTSFLSCLKILIFFWIPQKKYYHYQIWKKKELSYFAYRILSENTLHFILLCSSYIIPTHRKTTTKKRLPIKLKAAQMYLTLRSLKNYSFLIW